MKFFGKSSENSMIYSTLLETLVEINQKSNSNIYNFLFNSLWIIVGPELMVFHYSQANLGLKKLSEEKLKTVHLKKTKFLKNYKN
jgi:hypothetical protein